MERILGDMRVEEHFINNVVFVGAEPNGRFVPHGTGFLVHYCQEELHFPFLVTAHHVVARMRSDNFSVRINRLAGQASTITLDRRHAVLHSDERNDIALFSIDLDFTVYNATSYEISREKIEKERADQGNIFPGDSVCTIGLYTRHHGLVRNTPIVRVGNIAAMPNEPVLGPAGDVDAYLIELRTILGLSGSPVFVQPAAIQKKASGLISFFTGFPAFLLGVLVGYHRIESVEDQIRVPRFPPEDGSEDHVAPEKFSPDELNTGFGVVIPIERVLEMLESNVAKQAMNEAVLRHRKEKIKGVRGAAS